MPTETKERRKDDQIKSNKNVTTFSLSSFASKDIIKESNSEVIMCLMYKSIACWSNDYFMRLVIHTHTHTHICAKENNQEPKLSLIRESTYI